MRIYLGPISIVMKQLTMSSNEVKMKETRRSMRDLAKFKKNVAIDVDSQEIDGNESDESVESIPIGFRDAVIDWPNVNGKNLVKSMSKGFDRHELNPKDIHPTWFSYDELKKIQDVIAKTYDEDSHVTAENSLSTRFFHRMDAVVRKHDKENRGYIRQHVPVKFNDKSSEETVKEKEIKELEQEIGELSKDTQVIIEKEFPDKKSPGGKFLKMSTLIARQVSFLQNAIEEERNKVIKIGLAQNEFKVAQNKINAELESRVNTETDRNDVNREEIDVLKKNVTMLLKKSKDVEERSKQNEIRSKQNQNVIKRTKKDLREVVASEPIKANEKCLEEQAKRDLVIFNLDRLFSNHDQKSSPETLVDSLLGGLGQSSKWDYTARFTGRSDKEDEGMPLNRKSLIVSLPDEESRDKLMEELTQVGYMGNEIDLRKGKTFKQLQQWRKENKFKQLCNKITELVNDSPEFYPEGHIRKDEPNAVRPAKLTRRASGLGWQSSVVDMDSGNVLTDFQWWRGRDGKIRKVNMVEERKRLTEKKRAWKLKKKKTVGATLLENRSSTSSSPLKTGLGVYQNLETMPKKHSRKLGSPNRLAVISEEANSGDLMAQKISNFDLNPLGDVPPEE